MDKYSDQPNFVPFIVETEGRVGVAGRRFLDTLIGRLASEEEAAEPAQNGAVGGAPARADAAKLAQARKRAACGPSCVLWSGSRAICWHRSRASSTRRTARWRGWWASSATTGFLLLFFLWMLI